VLSDLAFANKIDIAEAITENVAVVDKEFVKPSVHAFLVCDSVIQDMQTRKMSVIGIFTEVRSTAFPCHHSPMGLYFCLSDAMGTYEFEVSLVNMDQEQRIGMAKLPPVKVDDRLKIVDIGVVMPPLVFPYPGRYEFRVSSHGNFVARKDFNVMQIQPQLGV
jgi:hypothetical protein